MQMKFLASRSNYDVVVAVNCCNGLPTNDYNLPYCCCLNGKVQIKRSLCEIADINSSTQEICLLDVLFSSNHNIHKSSFGFCFWASIIGSEA